MDTKLIILLTLLIGCSHNVQPKTPFKEKPGLKAPPPAYGNKVV